MALDELFMLAFRPAVFPAARRSAEVNAELPEESHTRPVLLRQHTSL